MHSAFAAVALAAVAAAMPQAVTSAISPSTSAPAGCSPDYDGSFQISVVNVSSTSKRDLERRQTDPSNSTPLTITLSGGVLTDSQGRTGYVASNQQFQFDSPPQAGAIYTAGFSVCSNGSLAIGGDAVWYKCLSGTFYNLYDENNAGQCSPVYIDVVPSGGSGGTTTSPSTTTTPVVSQISDGQVTATPVPPPSGGCTEYVDGQPQCPTTTATPVDTCTEYVDGQPQCATSTSTPVDTCTEYVDGQPQCATSTPVAPVDTCTEYVDGQPQCATTTSTPVDTCTEYVDGQPQCATTTPPPTCTEYVDGQPQCGSSSMASWAMPTGTVTGHTPPAYTGPVIATGAASSISFHREAAFALAAIILSVAML